MRMDNGQAYRQAAQVLPLSLRGVALDLPEDKQGRAEELRLRIGHPVTVVFPQGELSLGTNPVTGRELEQLLELASRASVHTVADQLRRGYLTMEGGHRVGLCGTPVLRDGQIHGLGRLSSAAIRVARQVTGAAAPVAQKLQHLDPGAPGGGQDHLAPGYHPHGLPRRGDGPSAGGGGG